MQSPLPSVPTVGVLNRRLVNLVIAHLARMVSKKDIGVYNGSG
jgi:hypothetical protein